MKNIHVLPTDKPTILFVNNEKLLLAIGFAVGTKKNKGQNIYITSDEEIRDLRPHKVKWHLEKEQILNKFPDYLTDLSECKLIILTTDQDLIKDGVQAIDNDFLEWYVKNPSCEFVEVKKSFKANPKYNEQNQLFEKVGYWKYKIIIPSEEPKQETLTYTESAKKEETIFNSTMMFKQKTLEEAFEFWSDRQSSYDKLDILRFGAVWQQKNSYSEEEFLEFSEWVSDNDWVYLPSKGYWVNEEQEESEQKFTTKELLEQFKNK